jgi:hypothetical protein
MQHTQLTDSTAMVKFSCAAWRMLHINWGLQAKASKLRLQDEQALKVKIHRTALAPNEMRWHETGASSHCCPEHACHVQ